MPCNTIDRPRSVQRGRLLSLFYRNRASETFSLPGQFSDEIKRYATRHSGSANSDRHYRLYINWDLASLLKCHEGKKSNFWGLGTNR